MVMRALRIGVQLSPRFVYRGKYYLGGDLPADPADPLSPDGRTKILNQPRSVRVRILERRSMRVVADVRSASDGTWRVDHLADIEYLVIGLDERGLVNAAIQDRVRPAPMTGP